MLGAVSLRRVTAALLVAVLLAALAPVQASPAGDGCLYAEDGRCIPAPAPPGRQPALAAQSQEVAPPGDIVRVKRRADIAPADFARLLRDRGYARLEGSVVEGWWHVAVPEGQSVEQVMADLGSLPEAEVVEDDKPGRPALVPNDSLYSLQWGPPAAGAEPIWDVTQGSPDVLIAVLDTGIDHRSPDAPSDLLLGWDYVGQDSSPFDDPDYYDYVTIETSGHGTHVAGIAAAPLNNSTGVAGMCPRCQVLAIRVCSPDSCTPGAVAQGIRDAAQRGYDLGKRTIINMSLSSGKDYQEVRDAVATARSLGAVLVAAAGNDGYGEPSYPAAYEGVLAVAATDRDGSAAEFSQYGGIAAPGVEIWSTVPLYYLDSPYAEASPYHVMSGTSQASPLVAGAVGLLWSSPAGRGLSPDAVVAELTANADGPPDGDWGYGGRLDVDRAIMRFTDTALPPGARGETYSARLPVRGGSHSPGKESYRVSAGALPQGLSLQPDTGEVSGVPSEAGSFQFTVHAQDDYLQAVDQELTLLIAETGSTVTPSPSRSASPTATRTPTRTATPAATATRTATPTATPSRAPTVTPSPSPTSTPTLISAGWSRLYLPSVVR